MKHKKYHKGVAIASGISSMVFSLCLFVWFYAIKTQIFIFIYWDNITGEDMTNTVLYIALCSTLLMVFLTHEFIYYFGRNLEIHVEEQTKLWKKKHET